MTENLPRVFIIDDDESVRRSLRRLITSAGYDVETFESANEFLAFDLYDGPCCLILDVRMPGLTGLDLQEELNNAHLDLPIIFITGHGDIPMSVKAMKAGAVDFLPKPFEDQQLLDAVHQAIEKHKVSRQERAALARIERRIASLTSREYQVFALVITGLLNKQIAAELGVTEKTVKVHRARVMQKMEVVSLAELARLAERIGNISVEGNLITGEVVKHF
ncbi:MAG: response regulator transcription factor [Bacteroidetes bacterium]|nr:response regulator transcription factor [Bacteroidota bacterium]